MSGSSSLRHLLNPEPRGRDYSPPSSPPRREEDNPTYRHRQPSLSTSDEDSDSDSDADDFFLLEDSGDEQEQEEQGTPADMAPSTRGSARRQSVVDLTDTPDARPTSNRRKRSTDAGPAARKKRRTTREPIEEIDLVDENPSVEEELRQAQQQATIRAQQAEVDAGPKKLGKLQCIICMESYTDATATACGRNVTITK